MPDFCFSRLWGDRGWLGCNELSKWGIVPLRGRLALLTCRALGTWRQLEHLCLIIEHEREKWKPIYKRALKKCCGHTWPYNGYHGCWNVTVTLVQITRSKQQQRDTWVNGGIINTARYKTRSNELMDRLFNGKGSDSRRWWIWTEIYNQ